MLALALLACTSSPDGTGEDTDIDVVSGPTLRHEPPVVAFLEGDNATLSINATDPEGVAVVAVYVRAEGSDVWESFDAFPDESTAGLYNAVIPGLFVSPPAIEYYFKAIDDDSPRVTSFLPDGGFDDPLTADVSKLGEPTPWTEDFEGAVSTLYGLGWREYSEGFEGYRWQLGAKASSGTMAASHKRGAAGVEGLVDWLVSPTIDLTGLDRAGVRWMERGDYANFANHSLWVSTGSPDPADGDYVLVQQLRPAKEDAFAASEWIDLSAWGDQRGVSLAWRWQGELADAWIIDDVRVDEMTPVLALDSVRWDPVHPGTSTTVEVTLENVSLVPAAAGTVTASLPGVETAIADGFDGSEQVLSDLAPGELITLSFPWTVPETALDNIIVPFEVVGATADETWTWDSDLVIGFRSEARATLRLNAPAVVDVSAIAFDPAEAGEELVVVEERELFVGTLDAGSHELSADLTGLLDRLPPAAGGQRWALRVDAEGVGSVESFRIVHDLQTWHSNSLGGFSAGGPARFYLPPPPAPWLTSQESLPDPASPGSVVDWTLTMANAVAPTTGRTTVTLVSDDPDAEVLVGGPFEVAADGWLPNRPAALQFQVGISPQHRDSTAVELRVVVEDELESFEVPAKLAVPWPHLVVTGVSIDDKLGGNNDGTLNAGEAVALELDITNVGGLDTFGGVSCQVSLVGSPEGATMLESTANLGRVRTLKTVSDDRPKVQLDANYSGDPLRLQFECADSATTYSFQYGPIALGEALWRAIDPLGDALGDVKGDDAFDFYTAFYRSDGTTLQFAFENPVAYDPSALFLELVFVSQGADYDDYQIVSQSGNVTVRGWDRFFGYSTLAANGTFSVESDTLVVLSVDLAPLGLTVDEVTIGFGSGFCGNNTSGDYYCDAFPDGWGNANGYSEAVMLDLDF